MEMRQPARRRRRRRRVGGEIRTILSRCFLLVTLFCSLTSFAQPEQQQQSSSSSRRISTSNATTTSTIADLIAQDTEQYSFLKLACQKTFLWQLLSNPTQIVTFLGPSDNSFQTFISIPPYSNYLTSAWLFHIQQVLLYHILPNQAVSAEQLFSTTKSSWPTAMGEGLLVNTNARTLGSQGASLVVTDQVALNGYWHVPNQVLLPDALQLNLNQLVSNSSTLVKSSPLNKYSFDTMNALLQYTHLDQTLAEARAESQGLTLLATPSTAWESFGAQRASLMQSLFQTDYLNVSTSILLYHMTPVNFYPSVLLGPLAIPELYVTMQNNVSAWFTMASSTATTASDKNQTNSTTTTTTPSNSNLFVNGAKVLVNNIFGSNGLIHIISQVLMPPDLVEQLTVTTEVTNSYSFFHFLSLLDSSRINLTSVPHATVFAPLDAAFDKNVTASVSKFSNRPIWIRHLKSIVSNHLTLNNYPTYALAEPTKVIMKSGYSIPVVTSTTTDGKNEITVGGASRVVLPDLLATNGIIHGIDRILLPPSVTQSIYEQLVGNPSQFSTLLLLLQATSAIPMLQDNLGPMTLLAPINGAFPGLYYTVSELPALMLGHVIPSNVFADELVNGTTVQALNGIKWPVLVEDREHVWIGGARITLANVLASNGVIQVIDKILQPPNGTTYPPTTMPPSPLLSPSLAPPSKTPTPQTTAPSRSNPRTLLPVVTPTLPTAPQTTATPTTVNNLPTAAPTGAANDNARNSKAASIQSRKAFWQIVGLTVAATTALLVS